MRPEIVERILDDDRVVGAIVRGVGVVWSRVTDGAGNGLEDCPLGETVLMVEIGRGAGFVSLADYVSRGLGEEDES